MVALNLAHLVLRGVTVLCDGANVELRHGASTKAGRGTPEIPFSMRHPSQGYTQEPFGKPADQNCHRNDGGDDSGAGRSLGLAGVLSRSTSTTFLSDGLPADTAKSVGRTALRWSGTNGGTALTTARLSSLATTATAARGEVNSGLLVNSNARTAVVTGVTPVVTGGTRSEVGEAWCKRVDI